MYRITKSISAIQYSKDMLVMVEVDREKIKSTTKDADTLDDAILLMRQNIIDVFTEISKNETPCRVFINYKSDAEAVIFIDTGEMANRRRKFEVTYKITKVKAAK